MSTRRAIIDRVISLRIDGKVVAENLTGLMLQVDPSGDVAIDVQRYRPEYQAEQLQRARAAIEGEAREPT